VAAEVLEVLVVLVTPVLTQTTLLIIAKQLLLVAHIQYLLLLEDRWL
jgi:hypothetical protein